MAKALSKFGKYAEGNLASTVNMQSETKDIRPICWIVPLFERVF